MLDRMLTQYSRSACAMSLWLPIWPSQRTATTILTCGAQEEGHIGLTALAQHVILRIRICRGITPSGAGSNFTRQAAFFPFTMRHVMEKLQAPYAFFHSNTQSVLVYVFHNRDRKRLLSIRCRREIRHMTPGIPSHPSTLCARSMMDSKQGRMEGAAL